MVFWKPKPEGGFPFIARKDARGKSLIGAGVPFVSSASEAISGDCGDERKCNSPVMSRAAVFMVIT